MFILPQQFEFFLVRFRGLWSVLHVKGPEDDVAEPIANYIADERSHDQHQEVQQAANVSKERQKIVGGPLLLHYRGQQLKLDRDHSLLRIHILTG